MGKTKNDAPAAIEAGKAITITAASREDATNQLHALKEQASKEGLTAQGGFIEHREGEFSAVITFVEQ